MAGFLRDILGGQKVAAPASPPSQDDADFADFAGAPDPSPASAPLPSSPTINSVPFFSTGAPTGPYTKWYRIWERTSPSEFYSEGIILLFLAVLIVIHVWGTKTNRRIAKKWLAAHTPLLEDEFAVVGYGGRKAPSIDDAASEGLARASISDHLEIPSELLKEVSPQEFITFASGRQNVAFVNIELALYKRYNPLVWFAEWIAGFLFESMGSPIETMLATVYPFDGQESAIVPIVGGQEGQEQESRLRNMPSSSYDAFVWAVVNKEGMKRLRDERYDISITSTKDNPKLPVWATVMSESPEVTNLLMTAELVKAIEEAGDSFNYLIISDQPLDKPTKLDETIPKKRISLSIDLDASPESKVALFSYFLRLPDKLVSQAHFRPEVLRKVRQTREEESRKLRKADEDEKAEERTLKRDKEKKEKREAMLKSLSADEQRKFLDREREKDIRKGQKRMTKKG